MEDYIKLFNSLSEAHIYPIETIPFCGTVIRGGALSDVNITCNIVDKGIETKNDDAYLVDMVVIKNTWQQGRTNNIVRAVIRGDVVLNGKVDCYSITFEQGAHLTINGGARLRIWEGGITNNDCTTVNYLTIVEDSVNDSYGEFLLHPDVSVNNHPLAIVEIISRSFLTASNYRYQRFGIPTHTKLTEVTAKNPVTEAAVPTYFSYFNYNTGKWEGAGYIHQAGQTMDYEKMAKPFDYYQMLNNASEMGTIVSMKGELYGNANPTISILGSSWFGIGNTYMGAIKTSLILSILAEHNISSMEVGPDNTEINASNVSQYPYIQPVYCQFLFKNSGTQFNLTLSYKDLVWDPSFEEEVTPTRSLMKGALTSPKPTEIDTTLEGSTIFDTPVPIFPPEHDER